MVQSVLFSLLLLIVLAQYSAVHAEPSQHVDLFSLSFLRKNSTRSKTQKQSSRGELHSSRTPSVRDQQLPFAKYVDREKLPLFAANYCPRLNLTIDPSIFSEESFGQLLHLLSRKEARQRICVPPENLVIDTYSGSRSPPSSSSPDDRPSHISNKEEVVSNFLKSIGTKNTCPYSIRGFLGKGGFAKVYLVSANSSKVLFSPSSSSSSSQLPPSVRFTEMDHDEFSPFHIDSQSIKPNVYTRPSSSHYALKVIPLRKKHRICYFLQELALVSALSKGVPSAGTRGIVRFHQGWLTATHAFLLMNFHKLSLNRYMKTIHKPRYSRTRSPSFSFSHFHETGIASMVTRETSLLHNWSNLKRFMRDCLMVVAHMHSRGVLHLDIKSDNIMLDLVRDPVTKAVQTRPIFVDFGLSVAFPNATGHLDGVHSPPDQRLIYECDGKIGTPTYMPYEILIPYYRGGNRSQRRPRSSYHDDFRPSLQYSKASDLWSLGMVFARLLLPHVRMVKRYGPSEDVVEDVIDGLHEWLLPTYSSSHYELPKRPNGDTDPLMPSLTKKLYRACMRIHRRESDADIVCDLLANKMLHFDPDHRITAWDAIQLLED